MNTGAVGWLNQVLGKQRRYIVYLMIVQALNGASGVLYALFLRNIVDSAVSGDTAAFWRAVALTGCLIVCQLLIRAVIRWLTELARSTYENILKQRLTDVLLHKDYLQVASVHSGEWMNRLTNDTALTANHLVDILPGLCGMLVKLISAVAMIVVLQPKFAMVLLPAGIILIVMTWLFRKTLKQLHKSVQESDGQVRIFLQERIGSLFMIRSFASEDRTSAEAGDKMLQHQSMRMRKNRFSNICNIGFGGLMSGMYLFGVCWCGYGILKGTITFGTLTAITQLIAQIQSPFANITGYLPKYYAMLASAERLMEAESFDEDEEQTVKSHEEVRDYYDHQLYSFGMHDVDFTYYPPSDTLQTVSKQNMPIVLKHFDLEIRKGEYVAFTGPSGCGKSTVLRLLMCVFHPDRGECCVRDKEGNSQVMTSAWRRLFAYVPQGNQLMNGTIREVVSFAAPEESGNREKLEQALQIACADQFVSQLEKGVDTLLGERGSGLSEGQMQRIAIARAVFSESPVLLLDEATSALDEQTEQKLLENLRQMTDRTVVIVTHRQAALKICDRIIDFTKL
ncbi:MAG: ABC transporter ATP-binding protein/permease [Solobacterium sp.]|nr:ABC transporter ATP-binding protein/permease [Solobacterium sp.]